MNEMTGQDQMFVSFNKCKYILCYSVLVNRTKESNTISPNLQNKVSDRNPNTDSSPLRMAVFTSA